MLDKIHYVIIRPSESRKKMGYKIESRKNERVTCFVPVDGKSGSAFDESQTIDISRGGIGFVSKKPIPLDEMIAVEIDVSPEDDPVLVMGKVLWVSEISESKEYRIGMQFGDILLDGSRERLKKYIQSE